MNEIKGEHKKQYTSKELEALEALAVASQAGPSKKYTSKELELLSRNSKALAMALRADPKLPTKIDEHARCLLHHVTKLGRDFGAPYINEIFSVLFKSEHLDFNIQDTAERTPLHEAFLYASDRQACRFVIPRLLAEANKRKNTDFELWDDGGRSIYHYALIQKAYVDQMGVLDHSLVGMINKNVTNPNWNHLSRSGATPFFYAINENFHNTKNIDDLLKSGADPLLSGSQNRNPLNWFEDRFNDVIAEIEKAPEDADVDSITAGVNNLNVVVAKVEATTQEEVGGAIQEAMKGSTADVSSEERSKAMLSVSNTIMSYFYPKSPSALEAALKQLAEGKSSVEMQTDDDSVHGASSTTTAGSVVEMQTEDDVSSSQMDLS